MGGGLESRCVGRVYGADGAEHHPHQVGISSYFMWKMHGQTTLNIVIILLHISQSAIYIKMFHI